MLPRGGDHRVSKSQERWSLLTRRRTNRWTGVAACELLIKRIRNYNVSLTGGNPVNSNVKRLCE